MGGTVYTIRKNIYSPASEFGEGRKVDIFVQDFDLSKPDLMQFGATWMKVSK